MFNTIVINPGGSSKKYALFVSGRLVLEAVYEKIGTTYQATSKRTGSGDVVQVITKEVYIRALVEFAKLIKDDSEFTKQKIHSIGVRIVAAGSNFQKHQIIDDVYLSLLRTKESTAPLHIPVTLREIQECRENFPGVQLVAVSDTAFFSILPPIMREYSLPREVVKELDIHRFGYHGLSVSSIVNRIHSVIGRDPERMIVCHVGSGVSVTGVRNNAAVYTSAGYTSLNTLPMTTRAGDVDAGAVLEILRAYNWSPTDINNYLHHQGGLTGIAESDDLRHILDRKSQGDTQASFAISLFTHALQEKIAAATVATGGVETIVFTGTIGMRSPEFRRLAVEKLAHLGIGIDEDKNNICLSREGVVSQSRSMVKVVVMRTDEMGEIARIAAHQIEIQNN